MHVWVDFRFNFRHVERSQGAVFVAMARGQHASFHVLLSRARGNYAETI
jgi:hypothetical protein